MSTNRKAMLVLIAVFFLILLFIAPVLIWFGTVGDRLTNGTKPLATDKYTTENY